MRPDRVALCLACAAVFFGGCASTPIERAAKGETECVSVREINSMGTLKSDRYVFVNASAARYYLFSVDEGCLGLRWATGMMIADGARRVCADGFTFITFVNPELGPSRCRVEWVESVENKAAAEALIRGRESERERR